MSTSSISSSTIGYSNIDHPQPISDIGNLKENLGHVVWGNSGVFYTPQNVIRMLENGPVSEVINHVQRFIIARDKLVFWEVYVKEVREQLGINLPGPGLANLTTSDAVIAKATEFESSFAANQNVLSRLTKLELCVKGLTSLPPEIGKFPALTHLDLRHNKLNSLPPEIGNLRRLQTLYMSENQLTSLPPEIGNLTALFELKLDKNRLYCLPSEIGKLTVLDSLDLGDNQLEFLPSEIGHLLKLRHLQVHKNKLKSLPSEIGNLRKMGILHIEDNQLESFPAEIGKLTEIYWFFAENNKLKSLPPGIGNLRKLIQLHLFNNELTSLPTEMGNLTELKYLTLDNNKLKSLPPEVGYCPLEMLTGIDSLYKLENKQILPLLPRDKSLIPWRDVGYIALAAGVVGATWYFGNY